MIGYCTCTATAVDTILVNLGLIGVVVDAMLSVLAVIAAIIPEGIEANNNTNKLSDKTI